MIDADALGRWLDAGEGTGAGGSVVLEGRPTGGGWSNDTIFIRVGARRLVVRLTPQGRSMFPDYDLGHQVRAMALAARAGLPVPAVLGFEPDASVLGRPFFVMERVEGRVPADDDPPFTKAGFVFDAPAGIQRRFHDNAVDAIAAIHRVSPPAFPTVGPSPAAHLESCRALAAWCGHEPVLLDEAWRRLSAAVPAHDPELDRFLWGDARPANMVLDDGFGIVALLDWELAAAGPGELDIAWFCEMNHMRSIGAGVPPLAGFPPEEETWKRWATAVGRAPRHEAWHRLFAAYRVAVFLQLYLATMVHRGLIPAGHRALAENAGTRRLAELLT